jgi:hypothetical protein
VIENKLFLSGNAHRHEEQVHPEVSNPPDDLRLLLFAEVAVLRPDDL